MTEQQLYSAIANFAEDFKKAQRQFSQRGQSLSERANRTQLSLSDMATARKFIREGVDITRDYFVACEAIIFALDTMARPMLSEGLSARGVGAVADLMKTITKDMYESSTTFTVSFNGVQLGEVGEALPKPGIQATSVQMFWEQQYKTMPDHAQEESRRKAEAEENKRKAQQAALEAQKAMATVQEQIAERKRQSEIVRERRLGLMKKCDEALQRYKASVLDAVSQLRSTLSDKNHKKADALAQKYSKLQAERKRAHREDRKQLDELLQKIAAEEEVLRSDEFLLTQIQTCRKLGDALVEQYEAALQQHVEKCYQEVEKADAFDVAVPAGGSSTAAIDDQQEEILDILHSSGWLTVSQIAVQMYGGLTNQRIAALLRQMMSAGRVSRVEDGTKAYFGIPGTPFRSSSKVWQENTKAANGPLPVPPAIQFREADYACEDEKSQQIQRRLSFDSNKKRDRSRLIWIILAAVAVIAAIIAGTTISNKIAREREAAVFQHAQEAANQFLQEALVNNAYWVEDNGVTEISATVQEVIFVDDSYLLYDYQKPHYLVKLRIDCTATHVELDYPAFLAGDITDYMPSDFGTVDGYRVYLRSETIKNSDKLYGGAPYELNSKMMVYIYVNGSFIQGPAL